MDRVCDNHDPVIITRQKQRSVVMVSLADFNAFEETAYLLRSPKNAERLDRAISDIRANKNLKKVVL
jgi:antitoxin YefM